MRQPTIYTALQLKKWNDDAFVDNRWIPARPLSYEGYYPLFHRFKVAFNVLIGKYDAVDWENNEK